MTGNEYQSLAARTVNSQLSDSELILHALHGMVGEIGEIHSIYQKVYQGHCMDEQHLIKEIGYLMWFIAEYCTAIHVNMNDVMSKNIEKLLSRYPTGFSRDNSLHRKEGDV